MLPSTPRVFLQRIEGYAARKQDKDNEQAAIDLGREWSLEDEIWDRPWTSLSGGEAQRTFLAIACTLKNTEVLLLDGTFMPALSSWNWAGLPLKGRSKLICLSRTDVGARRSDGQNS